MSSSELLEAAVDLLWQQNLLHGISEGYARLENDAQLQASWEAERDAHEGLEDDRTWREWVRQDAAATAADQEVTAFEVDDESRRKGYADAT